jgi:hypothetical protein
MSIIRLLPPPLFDCPRSQAMPKQITNIAKPEAPKRKNTIPSAFFQRISRQYNSKQAKKHLTRIVAYGVHYLKSEESRRQETGVRSQEPGKIIGIVEDWNNGIMGLRAKNILIIASSTVYCIKLVPLDPLFQHSKVFFNRQSH